MTEPSTSASPAAAASLSIEEQQIIAEIQELQRHLREIKASQADEDGDDGDDASSPDARPRRVLIVANRLPIRASRDARTARWTFDDAPGGLATALRGISMEVTWRKVPKQIGNQVSCDLRWSVWAVIVPQTHRHMELSQPQGRMEVTRS